jgi:hypothetical protein
MLEELSVETREHLFSTIEANVRFLRERDVIDYSLMLVFRERDKCSEGGVGNHMVILNDKYEMGMHIIDFLQVYN